MKLILDENFKTVKTIDIYESFIWTDRFSACGDFEIYTSVNDDHINSYKPDFYIWSPDSNHLMIIESQEITSDSENGKRLLIEGRSIESILERRIVWRQTILKGNMQDEIERLLNENLIKPTETQRTIKNFIFKKSENAIITALEVDAQTTGSTLYEVIKSLCDTNDIGFRVTLSPENQFIFELYIGEDRSYDQVKNPYVVFSQKFDNLLSSNYIKSNKLLRTVALVAGEGEGSNRKTEVVYAEDGAGSDLNRREVYVQASGVSSSTGGGSLDNTEYHKQLAQKGVEYLKENGTIETLEGKADTSILYRFGTDFYMGDIVQLENEYGIESRSRVTEIIFSQSLTDKTVCPTFITIKPKGETE